MGEHMQRHSILVGEDREGCQATGPWRNAPDRGLRWRYQQVSTKLPTQRRESFELSGRRFELNSYQEPSSHSLSLSLSLSSVSYITARIQDQIKIIVPL